jgi:hypothetical protein
VNDIDQPRNGNRRYLGCLVAAAVFGALLATVWVLRDRSDAPDTLGTARSRSGSSREDPSQPPRRSSTAAPRRDRTPPPRGGYTYQPITAELPPETRKPDQDELESSIRDFAEETWSRYQEFALDGGWQLLQFTIYEAPRSPRVVVQRNGRLTPVKSAGKADSDSPTPPGGILGGYAEGLRRLVDAMPASPPPSHQVTGEWRTQWIEAFTDALEWRSTGTHRMRSDGAIEADMRLMFDCEALRWSLPPAKQTFRAKEDEPAGFYADLFAGLFAVRVLAAKILEAPDDAARRDLIEKYFENAAFEEARNTWCKEAFWKERFPHKWVVVREP